jgi:N-acetylneuraminic acid mutarotase
MMSTSLLDRRPIVALRRKRTWIYVAVLAVLVVGAVGIVFAIQANRAKLPWLDASWQYRDTITATNSGGTALENYQLKVDLPADFPYGNAQPTGDDLRVTTSDGVTLLKEWTERFDAKNRTGTVWVKVPLMPAGSTVTMYLYYGNPDAKSSSTTAIFPFFDGFTRQAWTSLPNMPFHTADEGAATVDGKFYIIGGYNNSAADVLASNYQYDPVKRTYTPKASMPTARWGLIAVAVNNKIYAMGGSTAHAASAANEVYDPATDRWSVAAKVPAALGFEGITGCTDGKNIFLFYDGLAYEYLPASNTYKKLATMPTTVPVAVSWAACSYYGGKIYVMGGYGRTAGGGIDTTLIYNIASNSWKIGARMPFGVYGAVRESPVINGGIYIVNGQRRDAEFSSEAYRYDTSTDEWADLALGPHAADGVAGGVINGKVYVFGGRQDETGPYGLNFASVYDPSVDTYENWPQMSGDFEINGGTLHRMTPVKGTIVPPAPSFAQLDGLYKPGSGPYVLEIQGTQGNSGWNALVTNSNSDVFGAGLTGNVTPYNDFGSNPASVALASVSGTSLKKVATAKAEAGPQRVQIAMASSQMTLYINGTKIGSATVTGGDKSPLGIVGSNSSTASWDFIFTHAYAATVPSVRVAQD